MRRGKWLLLGLLAGGCIPRAEPQLPPRSPVPAPVAAVEPRERQCGDMLSAQRVRFHWLGDRRFEGGCSQSGTVQLVDIGTNVSNLGPMTCPLAARFVRWTRDAVQPAAAQWLDSPVERIETMGTYSCRGVNGRPGARLSEHAFANAVDVGAFLLADGRRITVKEGWRSGDEKVRGFLREVHRGGCRTFAIGLGPDADVFHHDHLHFDMGRGPYCR